MELIDILWTSYIFVIGLLFGSFFNVVGIRIPNHRSLSGRSHCPNCDHTLGVVELIPIIGYLILRGRCRHCQSNISIQYPLFELLTGVLFAISYIALRETLLEFFLVIAFVSLLIIVTISDLHERIVPDVILLIGLPILLTLRILSPVMPWYEGLIGGVLAFLFMYLIAIYGKKRFGKEALGGGDIKLYGLIGLVLGYNTVFLSVLFAALAGLLYYAIVRPKDSYLPFVPFIAFGSLLTYFIGPGLVELYLTLFL